MLWRIRRLKCLGILRQSSLLLVRSMIESPLVPKILKSLAKHLAFDSSSMAIHILLLLVVLLLKILLFLFVIVSHCCATCLFYLEWGCQTNYVLVHASILLIIYLHTILMFNHT